MLFSRRTAVTLLFVALAPLAVFGASAKRAAPTRPGAAVDNSTAFKGAIIIDAATGGVLFEDRADYSGPPASMTKLMTFAVLSDKLASGALTLQTPVTVTAADSKIGGSQVWLKEGETFPVEELMYAMMIHSANDAAYALARTAAGSAEAFVELMNAKAQALGMKHTTFRSPHGLPPATRKLADGDLTTPRDFSLLCLELMKKTDVLKYTSIKARDFGTGVRPQVIKMTNSDHLIGQVAGADGLKTGFTNGAGFCLSSTAQRNGRRVLVVLMGAPDSKTRDLKVVELLERGFTLLPPGGPAFAANKTATTPAPATPAATAPATHAASASSTTAAPPSATATATPAPAAANDSPLTPAPTTATPASTAAKPSSDSTVHFSLPPPPKKK